VRNRAHLAVLYRTGIRCRESCTLERKDVEERDGAVALRVRQPKGWQKGVLPREVALDDRVLELLREWLCVRGDGPGWLFCTKTGLPVQTSYLRQLLPRLARRAGVARRVHPHALRHTFARELYDEKVGPIEIQLALGHAKLLTTQTYLRSIGATQVNEILRRRRW
jgi:integrase